MLGLIVDDDRIIQKIHKAFLKKSKIESEVVGNGKEAVDLVASGKKFDLILMDLDMPVMNGIEATRTLRAMGVNSMIVGITARSQTAEQEAFIEAGANFCYAKPLNAEKVAGILHQFNN